MMAEMKLAAILAKVQADDATAVPAAEALQIATLNGARALGLEHLIGSLEVGKCCDMVAVALDDLETIPCFDVISNIVYAAAREQCMEVWVDGQCLMRRRELCTIDSRAVKETALTWQRRILEGDPRNSSKTD